MGKVLPILILITVVLVVGAFMIIKNPTKNQTLLQNPKIEATYTGTIPCADCPGIDETITFYSDKTYNDKNIYQERNVDYTAKGSWGLTNDIYELTNSESGNKSYYQIQGNKIVPLDPDTKKPIVSPLNLSLTKVFQ